MGATTNYGIPYPELSDPPDGAGQMKALATSVDGAMYAGRPTVTTRKFTTNGFSLPNNVYTDVPFEVGGSAPYTAPVHGIYSLGGYFVFTTNATGGRNIRFLLDGAQPPGFNMGATAVTHLAMPTIHVELNAGQQLQCQALQNSGAALVSGAFGGYYGAWFIMCQPL